LVGILTSKTKQKPTNCTHEVKKGSKKEKRNRKESERGETLSEKVGGGKRHDKNKPTISEKG